MSKAETWDRAICYSSFGALFPYRQDQTNVTCTLCLATLVTPRVVSAAQGKPGGGPWKRESFGLGHPPKGLTRERERSKTWLPCSLPYLLLHALTRGMIDLLVPGWSAVPLVLSDSRQCLAAVYALYRGYTSSSWVHHFPKLDDALHCPTLEIAILVPACPWVARLLVFFPTLVCAF
ncbi:hypothetical protein COCCADRAFT_26977 [Bipolaris zeicola 26-R-13]|uniref:Uncharacterized protein n=1 Tax=Cochliobolus carbonum (strain 26-R-13) TaxID=930089 RepID=W6Y4B7_COCC2|nr:uncharacterized protein COCCADRAFT_26977 [Bipolaris zeicola 26-R-13]EUC32510.1 hypothetical protein COCCADRAFT_26977 [Bipolaris zeicola 26-R-13]